MPTPMNDPTVLRAIAHPVRNRILAELEAFGSMRAADVAASLGVPANQASFHLRQLARYGLVEEDPAAARDRRDRVWRVADPDGMAVQLDQVEKAPGGAAASAVFRRTKAAWAHHLVDVAYGDDREPGVYRSVSEYPVGLSRSEAEELDLELRTVTERWIERARARSRSSAAAGPGAPPETAAETAAETAGGTAGGTDEQTDEETDGAAGVERRTYLHFQMVLPYPRDAIDGEG